LLTIADCLMRFGVPRGAQKNSAHGNQGQIANEPVTLKGD
jgi:hypothetical protein